MPPPAGDVSSPASSSGSTIYIMAKEQQTLRTPETPPNKFRVPRGGNHPIKFPAGVVNQDEAIERKFLSNAFLSTLPEAKRASARLHHKIMGTADVHFANNFASPQEISRATARMAKPRLHRSALEVRNRQKLAPMAKSKDETKTCVATCKEWENLIRR